VLELRNLLAAHTASDECHYHNDIAQPEGDPTNQKYLVQDENWTTLFCIVLTCEIQVEGQEQQNIFFRAQKFFSLFSPLISTRARFQLTLKIFALSMNFE